MTNVSQLPISGITINPDVNIRELDTDYVSELMEAQLDYGESHWQAQWKDLPKINQDGILFSGFHTVTAAQRNFGDAHEVSFQVVEGNPYLLAACENASHGKRRTNADKRSAVLRWLQDDEGKQWTDSYIAKQCHVSDSLVNSVDLSLQENGSDKYDRPTKRKYIDKHGNVSWMETAKINDATGESEAVIAGKKTAGEVLKARDAATAKKRKKQVLKNIWDTCEQAATDYIGKGNTDLNHYLTLPELEKGFAENNESYADAFGSGMQRIDRTASFKDFQDRAFEVDEFGLAKVDISELQEEYRAIMTYSGDIRQWKRPDWSPDTNWILPLIEAKKKSEAKSAPKPEPEPDLKTLREQVKVQMSKYKQWYKDSGYQESDLVSRASFSQFIHVFREYRETPQEGAATVEELKDLLDVLKRKSYPFAHKLRQIVRPEQSEPDEQDTSSDTEKAEALAKFRSQKRDLYAQIHETPLIHLKDEFGNVNSDKAIHRFMLAAYSAYDLPENLLWSDQAVEALSTEEISKLTGQYFLFAQDLVSEPRADWVGRLYQDVDASEYDPGLNDRMDKCRADLLQVWQQQEVYTWEGLEIELYAQEYGLSADVIAVMQSEIAAAHPKPEPCEPKTDSDEDTSLTEIDNLPAVKHFLESLLKQTETFIHPHDKDDFSVSVFDALMIDSELTERQQLLILIDCAYSIVMESESTSL